MLEYASQDVLYLPKSYEAIRQRLLLSEENNKVENLRIQNFDDRDCSKKYPNFSGFPSFRDEQSSFAD